MENNVTRIYANKIDYITYLFRNPILLKKIGSKLILPSAAIMNFILYKKCFAASDEAIKRNQVYLASIHKFLEHLPQDLVAKAARKLISTGQIVKSDRDILHISNEVAQYFYGLTKIETFNTVNTSEIPNKAKTVKTDNSGSSFPLLKCFGEEKLRNILKNQKLSDDDFKSRSGQLKIMRVLVYTFMDSAISQKSENRFVEDLAAIFIYFGSEKNYVLKLYEDIKKEFLTSETQ